MNNVIQQAVNASLRSSEALVRQWLSDGKLEGQEWVAKNPTRNDSHLGSFKINLQTGKWGDFATGDDGGDFVSLYAYLNSSSSQLTAAREVLKELGIAEEPFTPATKPKPAEEWIPIVNGVPFDAPRQPTEHYKLGKPSGVWTYHTPDGRVLHHVCRFDKPLEVGQAKPSKDFYPLSLCRSSNGLAWRWKALPEPRPLFNLNRLADNPQSPVVLCEGEAKSLAAGQLTGRTPTCNSGGSNSAHKANFNPLQGRDVLVWADADEAGRKWLKTVLKLLNDRGCTISVVNTDGLDESIGFDAKNALDEGWTKADVEKRIIASPEEEAFNEYEKPITTDDPYRGTDDAYADLFLSLHGKDIRYCPTWEKWLIWTGTHWAIDDKLQIDGLACNVIRELYRRASEINDRMQRKQVVDTARRLESVSRRNAMMTASRHRAVIHHSKLDKSNFLLNVRNGTIDLKTGELRQHYRSDYLTHDLDIHYSPNAVAHHWNKFLETTFNGDTGLIQFIQRAFGYSLTGDVSEQILLICYGVGSNGKSVFLNILRKLMSNLALQAAPDLLMADKNRRHPTEQADLFSKRLVICQETGDGRRFDEALVKRLTGGDGIRVRRMHEDFWEFEPTHKLWLSTNHKPEIKGTDYAIWRRIRLIPFTVKFTDDGEARKDPEMEVKLTVELPGILAWAVQGCLAWQREGLIAPEAVKTATESYRQQMDAMAGFIDECCVVQKNAKVKATDLYIAYTNWCEQSGEYSESQRKFGMRLSERGFLREKTNGCNWWLGIGLCATNDSNLSKAAPIAPLAPGNGIKTSSTSYEGKNMPNPGAMGAMGAGNSNATPKGWVTESFE